MKAKRRRRGSRAEDLAATFLEQQGYLLLARNVHYPFGELDLVCRHPRRGLVVVEVRSLDPRMGFHPAETLTLRKRLRLERAIHAFLQRHPELQTLPLHLDVVTVLWEDPPRLEHLPDAFGF